MTEADEQALKDLAKAIQFGPTRHGEVYPFVLKKLKEAYQLGAAAHQEQPKKDG